METILNKILSFLFPKAPSWVSGLIAVVIPAVVSAVREIREAGEGEVFEASTLAVAELLDDAFDDIPKWSDLDEAKRDAIVVGLAELALFIEDLVTSEGEPATVRSLKRAARRAARKASA